MSASYPTHVHHPTAPFHPTHIAAIRRFLLDPVTIQDEQVTREQWAVLCVLAGGSWSRDELASMTGIDEHVVGVVLNGLMRASLVGRARSSSGRPQYGLTKVGRDRVWGATNWRDLDPELERSSWVRLLHVFEQMAPSPVRPTNQPPAASPASPTPVAPPASAGGPGGDAELRQAALVALLAGRLTRDRMAVELGVSEHVAGRVLDRLIWDSLVLRRAQDSGRPMYELRAAGRQKVLGVSPQLQEMAQKPVQKVERVVATSQPALKPRRRLLSWLQALLVQRRR